MSDTTMSAMKKLLPGQAAFGNCRRLDEDYLNRVLKYDEYVTIDSRGVQTSAPTGPSIPQIGMESSSSPLELNKAIRSVNFRSLHRLLSFPLTEMISTAPPDLSGTCTSPCGREVDFAKIFCSPASLPSSLFFRHHYLANYPSFRLPVTLCFDIYKLERKPRPPRCSCPKTSRFLPYSSSQPR